MKPRALMPWVLTAATVLLAMAPCLAFAADTHAGEPVPGMPQLAFGHPEQGRYLIASVVWLFIIFGVLYVVMAQYALPQVESVLEARRSRIEGDLEQAQAAKQRADAALAEHQAATARARAEAQAAIAAATQQAQAEAATKAEALNAKLNAQIEAAEQRIAASRDSAMAALRSVASDTAEALVARLTGGADRGAIDQAVGAELAARGRA
ncbi:F0F1 ATP synthase subunit B family protein [Paracraurococcus lichenis]|uniref:ATP synthase subunit b n=1 Tax=Paracraurococcus lichenis TaxID=3064888 RepID=A0ABT9E1N3_9PROT|nr:F0F1 ATP synthase subunit B' [Paracraurococcus sp. LOR1-02]MDO9710056.1 F0F1 ATP synthase subunit B' [Paracraurococcus sp. LOR1-02]